MHYFRIKLVLSMNQPYECIKVPIVTYRCYCNKHILVQKNLKNIKLSPICQYQLFMLYNI